MVYMHLDSVSVTSGKVTAGQKIGVSGDTGEVDGAHLHYGVYLNIASNNYAHNTHPLNPLLFVTPQYYANGENGNRLGQI